MRKIIDGAFASVCAGENDFRATIAAANIIAGTPLRGHPSAPSARTVRNLKHAANEDFFLAAAEFMVQVATGSRGACVLNLDDCTS